MTKGRSIRLFLADGTPGGIITAEIMNWTGHAMFAPRSRLADMIKRQEAARTGVYFLTGLDPEGAFKPLVYIGETDNVGKRLAQHNKDESKDFWDRACVITSKDQNLTKAHVRYLESRLIAIATEAGRATLVNGTAPDYGLLPEADIADMEFFIEQVRIVLPVLGLDFLKDSGEALLSPDRDMLEADKFARGIALGDALLAELDQAPPGESFSGIRTYLGRSRPSSGGKMSPEFEIRDNKGTCVAHAFEVDGEMVVLKGSQARKDERESLTSSQRQRRRDLVTSGVLKEHATNHSLYVFTADTPFNSPSLASTVILARADNGRKSWFVKGTKKTYADWQEEQVAAVSQDGGEE